MRGILKNTLLLLGGMALGSLATRRAIRYAVENRYDRVKYEEPIFGTGEDAEQVLDGLKTLISTYGNATAADLYEMAGTHDFKYEMTRIGWTSVDGAEIVQTDDGYIITLPSPSPSLTRRNRNGRVSQQLPQCKEENGFYRTGKSGKEAGKGGDRSGQDPEEE